MKTLFPVVSGVTLLFPARARGMHPLSNAIAMKLVENSLVETTNKNSLEEQIRSCLEKLTRASDFDIDYQIAPVRNLVSDYNIVSLYLTAFIIEKLLDHLTGLAGGLHHLRVAVKILEQEFLEHDGTLAHPGAESHQRRQQAHGIRARRPGPLQPIACRLDHVINLGTQHPAYGLVEQTAPGTGLQELRICLHGLQAVVIEEGDRPELLQRDDDAGGEQQLFLNVKTAPSYTLSDLDGTWYSAGIKTPVKGTTIDPAKFGYDVFQTVVNSGTATFITIATSDISGTSVLHMAIDSSGTISAGIPNCYWYMNASKDVMFNFQVNTIPGQQQLLIGVKKAASYSTADLTGVWYGAGIRTQTKNTSNAANLGYDVDQIIINADGSGAVTPVASIFDFGQASPGERQVAENPGSQLPDIASPE